jgi:hypothetical protein
LQSLAVAPVLAVLDEVIMAERGEERGDTAERGEEKGDRG